MQHQQQKEVAPSSSVRSQALLRRRLQQQQAARSYVEEQRSQLRDLLDEALVSTALARHDDPQLRDLALDEMEQRYGWMQAASRLAAAGAEGADLALSRFGVAPDPGSMPNLFIPAGRGIRPSAWAMTGPAADGADAGARDGAHASETPAALEATTGFSTATDPSIQRSPAQEALFDETTPALPSPSTRAVRSSSPLAWSLPRGASQSLLQLKRKFEAANPVMEGEEVQEHLTDARSGQAVQLWSLSAVGNNASSMIKKAANTEADMVIDGADAV